MPKSTRTHSLFSIFVLLLVAATATAQQMKLSLEEVAQEADLIIVGTVEKQESRFNAQKSMIFTDLLLSDIEVVHATGRSLQKSSSVIRLTYAGGRVGDIDISLSITPKLLVGHRYLIFMSDDGTVYANPIIGGNQGLFEVIKDPVSQKQYLLTADERPIIGVDSTAIVTGERRAIGAQNKIMLEGTGGSSLPDGFYSQPATPNNSSDAASTMDRSATNKKIAQAEPLNLEEFINFVTQVSLKEPVKERLLKRSGTGLFYQSVDGKIETQELPRDFKTGSTEFINKATGKDPALDPAPPTDNGGAVGACGYQNLKILMEQVPTSFWSYSINNDSMYAWNRFMDIYRYSDSDGTFGNNSQNEFGGFPSDSTLYSIYGFHWNGALAVTVSYSVSSTQCTRITQADLLWNPAYSWTSDANYALGNSGVILLRSVNMHELGHVWGLQDGIYTETYDYDVATVMQPYYSSIVEDGYGVHRSDAYLIRRQYQNQTAILGTRDVGVESYYASNGLKNSTTNASSYVPGQSISLYNVTVENMGYSAVSDMRIRFYLSTNRTITTTDYQLGSYWFWSSFPAESYNVGSYTTTIPSNIPAGQYYVGALVSINGFGVDDYTYNDATSFYYGPITIGSASASPAQITSPANGSTFSSSTATFNWSPASGSISYYLDLSSSPGSRDIYANFVSGGSTTVTGIPTDGRTIYVRLWSLINGSWLYYDYSYKAFTSNVKAAITSPANGSTFTAATVNFNWNTVAGATQYFLDLNSSPGSRDIFANYVTGGATTVSGIPTDGRTIYVRLWTYINGGWLFNDYTYKACSNCGSTLAQITSPANNSTFGSSTITFSWNTVGGASQYFLDLNSSPGSRDIFADYVTGGSKTVSGIPNDGRTIYVRLWTLIGSTWNFNSYTYKACAGCSGINTSIAQITSPANGSTFAASSVTFTWNPVAGASQYFLDLNSSPGSRDIFANYVSGGATTVSGIPVDGRTIYVRMWTNIGGVWFYNAYTYKAKP